VDDPLFELETDKVTLTINAEHAGKLTILVEAGSTVKIGQKVASIDAGAGAGKSDAEAGGDAGRKAPSPPPKKKEAAAPVPGDGRSGGKGGAEPAPADREEGPPKETPAGMEQARTKLETHAGLSPAVRRLVDEHRLDPRKVKGTGKEGRITKGDVIEHLERARSTPRTAPPSSIEKEPALEGGKAGAVETEPAAKPEPAERTGPGAKPAPAKPDMAPGERQTRVPMSTLRQRIAERLVKAQQTAAILTTFNEIDMTSVIAWRDRHREAFMDRHGVKLGFMSFFVKASVDALETVPEVGAQIQGDEIVYNHFHDIGVAVSTEKGLVVPVIRDADRMNFGEIEKAIAELARKARERTLSLSDLSGGVFTISNGGIYGNMMSTPILNPPQSGILGMHTIKKRPVVVDDEIVVRPMMYVALSYDHRLVDGREAVTFLKRIVDCIENPERMMLEI
jgi:2-oxoglutarate dehydrogenase E2 component (dihydrolipoamide succinyltransferase)